ncbi:MAG TPA: CDP-alcohol phosphatidyltransferase family protein [Candidatus Limnocylindria bacterium]|nr:CDP-alcohol phosphatidyltransferase family protein [Candidatus Limnocylindria bacterium]
MNLPILIAVGRAVATFPVCVLLVIATPETDTLALGLFAVAVLSDVIDGRLARARGQVTALGASLDPLADKILIVGTLSALAVRGLVPPWALAVIIGRELAAVSLRARSRHPLPATADGKAKTVLQVVAAATGIVAAASRSADVGFAAQGLLLAAVALTVVSGVRLMLRAARTTAHAA